MKRASTGPILSTVFVDYDNIYLSLKRKNDDAAKRFAKDSGVWLQGIISGELITPTSTYIPASERRIAMNRCYGNPVPRRNSHDNSTDMNSFPFVRHHFLRSGFEVIDCPPLTAQLKNSADIRIVMDIRDILTHDTFFDEFIILSGDADFTPVLHRLRAHARRTVVFANDHTAQPYTALSDGEIRESSLLALLLNDRAIAVGETPRGLAPPQSAVAAIDVDEARHSILAEVVQFVRSAPQAVPLETLADRAVRIVGREKTVGTNWGGFNTFRDLLLSGLPDDVHLSDTPPYTVFDANRHISAAGLLAPQTAQLAQPIVSYDARTSHLNQPADVQPQMQRAFRAPAPQNTPHPHASGYQQAEPPQRQIMAQPVPQRIVAENQSIETRTYEQFAPEAAPSRQYMLRPAHDRFAEEPVSRAPQQTPGQNVLQNPVQPQPQTVAQSAAPLHPAAQYTEVRAPQYTEARVPQYTEARAPVAQQRSAAPPQPAGSTQQGGQSQHGGQFGPRTADHATQIQQSIARIHDACQAPALAPAEYRVLFDVMAQEISSNGLQGAQTLVNLTQRAREFGLDLKRDDLRFILEVVSESDPWFEQGASANLFASRFRNFVVARCRSQGLSLSSDELDLVEAWFSAQPTQQQRPPVYSSQPAPSAPPQQPAAQNRAPSQPQANAQPNPQSGMQPNLPAERWWSLEEGRQHIADQRAQSAYNSPEAEQSDDEFPRIVRSRLRG